jgi:predicted transcriptional regulator of viral defense system
VTESLQPHQQRQQALFEVADAQSGYFTAQQARQAGYSQQSQAYSARVGNWQRVRWGLYRLPQYPATPHEQYAELSLWSRTQGGEPQAVIGFETALALHELSDLMPERIHLIVPKSFRKPPPPGVVLHPGTVAQNERQAASGFQLTTPLRTLTDLADTPLSPEHLGQALQQALERGLIRRRTLHRWLDEQPPKSLARHRLLSALEDQ